MMRPPNFSRLSDAPKTAIERGCSMRSIEISGAAAPSLRCAVCRARRSDTFEDRRPPFAKSRFAFLRVVRRVVELGPPRLDLARRGRREPVLRAHRLLDRAKADRRTGG